MRTITITATVDEKRRIMIDLPDDVPLGEVIVDVTVRAIPAEAPLMEYPSLTRDEARARLIASGLLNPQTRYAPPDAEDLSEQEEEQLADLAAGGRSILDLVNEDREERF